MSGTKEPLEASSGTPASSPSPRTLTTKQAAGASAGEPGHNKGSDDYEDAKNPSNSSSIGTAIRIVVLFVLSLAVIQYSISVDRSGSPLDDLIQFLQPVLDTASSAWSSLSSSSSYPNCRDEHQGRSRNSNRKRSAAPSPSFGTPLLDLYPEGSPMHTRWMQQEALHEKAARREHRQQKQKRSQSPFESFFGGGEEDQEDDDSEEDVHDHTNSEGMKRECDKQSGAIERCICCVID